MSPSVLNLPAYGLRLRALEGFCLVEQVRLAARAQSLCVRRGPGAGGESARSPRRRADTPRRTQALVGSPSAADGLELGDILERVDGEPVVKGLDWVDLTRVARALQGPEGSVCSLRVLKHTGEPADLQLRRVPGDSHALLLAQVGLWVRREPGGAFVVMRVLSETAAHFSGQCAIGDTIAAVASVVPQSLDHLDELVSGSDGSLVDLEIIQQYGRKDSVTLHYLRAGTPAAQPLLPFEAESDEAGIGVQVEAVEGGNRAAVSVTKIEEGSPAYWSDLRVGDVITHVNSMAIDTAGAFRSHGHGAVGTRLVLAVEREETLSLRVVLIRAHTLRQAALACAKAYKNKVLQLLHDQLQGSQRLAHVNTIDAKARESPIDETNANLNLERMQVSECTEWEMGTPAGEPTSSSPAERSVVISGETRDGLSSIYDGMMSLGSLLDTHGMGPLKVRPDEEGGHEMEQELREGQVSCTLKLNLAIESVTDMVMFKLEVAEDIAFALGMHPARVRVLNVRPGSVLVDVQLNPDINSCETELVNQLIEQSAERASALLKGKFTCKTMSVVASNTSVSCQPTRQQVMNLFEAEVKDVESNRNQNRQAHPGLLSFSSDAIRPIIDATGRKLPEKNLKVEEERDSDKTLPSGCNDGVGLHSAIHQDVVEKRASELHAVEVVGAGDSPVELSIGCKMAAIDVMQNIIRHLSKLDPQHAGEIVSLMEHNPDLATDEILRKLSDHSKPRQMASMNETGGQRCSICVRVIEDFNPHAVYKPSTHCSSGMDGKDYFPCDVLGLVSGDFILTTFCGDHGWAWGTCIRHLSSKIDDDTDRCKEDSRIGRSGWFPWDFVEVTSETILVVHCNVPSVLVQEFAAASRSLALCICGWDCDRNSAITIRPGQVIHVVENGTDWSRGSVCHSQHSNAETDKTVGWFPSKFVTMLLNNSKWNRSISVHSVSREIYNSQSPVPVSPVQNVGMNVNTLSTRTGSWQHGKTAEKRSISSLSCSRDSVSDFSTSHRPASNGSSFTNMNPSMLSENVGQVPTPSLLQASAVGMNDFERQSRDPGVVQEPHEVFGDGLMEMPYLTALHSYTPMEPDELAIEAGQRLRLLHLHGDGWCRVRDEAGQIGVVPANYVSDPADLFKRLESSRQTGKLSQLRSVSIDPQSGADDRSVSIDPQSGAGNTFEQTHAFRSPNQSFVGWDVLTPEGARKMNLPSLGMRVLQSVRGTVVIGLDPKGIAAAAGTVGLGDAIVEINTFNLAALGQDEIQKICETCDAEDHCRLSIVKPDGSEHSIVMHVQGGTPR